MADREPDYYKLCGQYK